MRGNNSSQETGTKVEGERRLALIRRRKERKRSEKGNGRGTGAKRLKVESVVRKVRERKVKKKGVRS